MAQHVQLSGTRSSLLWLISLLILAILGACLLVLVIWLPQRQIEQHYQAGIVFQNLEDWEMAADEFVRVIQLDATYKDVQPRLAAVKQAQATQQATVVEVAAIATVDSSRGSTPTSDPSIIATIEAQGAATDTAEVLSVLQQQERATVAAQVAAATVTASQLLTIQRNAQATATAQAAAATTTAELLLSMQQDEQATATAQAVAIAETSEAQSAAATAEAVSQEATVTALLRGFIHIRNQCPNPIRIALGFQNKSGDWEYRSWWNFDGGQNTFLSTGDVRLSSNNDRFYYYAEASDGSGWVWKGDHSHDFAGTQLDAREILLTRDDDGDWVLSLTCAKSIDWGTQVSGNITTVAGERWQFSAIAGSPAEIMMTSDDMDTYLELQGAEGSHTWSNDDGDSSNTNSRIYVDSLPLTGNYIIIVRGHQGATGSYQLTLK